MRWEIFGPYKDGEVFSCRVDFNDFDEYIKALETEIATNFGPGTGSRIEIYDNACEAARGVILWRQGPDGFYGKIMTISLMGLMQAGHYTVEFNDFFRETHKKFQSLIKAAIGERIPLSD